MVRAVSNELQAHLEGECTTLATCWKVIRRDGVTMGFTDYVRNIGYDFTLYKAESAFAPTAVQMKSDFSVDNIEVEGVLDSAEISEADLQAGVYDYAELQVFMLNYLNPAQGPLYLKRGWIGEVSLQRGKFTAEIRGLAQKLSQNIGRYYSESCDANLGDARCKADVSGVTGVSVIKTVMNHTRFETFTSTGGNGFFKGGVLSWTSGANAGLSIEVKEFIADQLEIVLPMLYAVTINDAFTLTPGCDKSRRTCRDKFQNLVNFRGFPDLPGQDKLYETSSTRTETV